MQPPLREPLSPRTDSEKVRAAVSRFGEEVLPRMRGDGRMEDRIREPIYNLLRSISAIIGRDIVVHDEVPLADISARPDFAVDSAAGRLGFIELKSSNIGIPNHWNHPTKHDKEQWQKLSGLPNVIYTDGLNWALFRKGEQCGGLGRLQGDLTHAGRRLSPADAEFERIIREFLVWRPDPPITLRKAVSDIAPLCRLLRHQVSERMAYEATSLAKPIFTELAREWRETLFPNLSDEDFADAYAQTVTFALLLARVDGVAFDGRSMGDIAEQLSKQHSLMGQALSILANSRWVSYLSVVDTIRRVIGGIDLDKVGVTQASAYALLYETFLAEYDPKLRRKSGTYYTPDSVARAMVSFVDQVLKRRFGRKRGFAASDVYVIDPAMGTGTFLVSIIDSVASTLMEESKAGHPPGAHLSELFAERLIGFELQAAPFAVAEMRLHHTLKNRYKTELPRSEVRFLSNALDDPDKLPLPFGQLYDVLKENHEHANRIKRDQDVMVIIGNPPWRQHAKGEAPWVEEPRPRDDLESPFPASPSLDEFRARSQGRRAFNLSNMWTFFWRWATWKVFEANRHQPMGIVALITPQAYMTSDSYAGMRGYLREACDEGWIIDLTPEGFQPPSSTRIFPTVQQPICIGIFARYGAPYYQRMANTHYIAITGSQAEKFNELHDLEIDESEWRDCPRVKEAPFLPIDSTWLDYPRLDDLLPWQQPGVTPNRNWVYAPDEETLGQRWRTLLKADDETIKRLFKVTRDRHPGQIYRAMPPILSSPMPLSQEVNGDPSIRRASFRSFDNQYLICDRRVIDFPRRELWEVWSADQVYACQPPAYRFTGGPALTFSALVPNVDNFMGHHGGQAIPLYRDAAASNPNVAPKLLDMLGEALGIRITEKDLLAYAAGVVAHPAFTKRFAEELRAPGIRLPLTVDPELWAEEVEVGSELIWLHTYGECFIDETKGRPRSAPRLPEEDRPLASPHVPPVDDPRRDDINYDPATQSITIGDRSMPYGPGRIERVPPEIWEYTVGDMPVVSSWLDYRRYAPRHKKRTSALDDINQPRWTAEYDDDLIDLLNVIGRCVALEERQANLLQLICDGPQVKLTDLLRQGVLPAPEAYCRPPLSPIQDELGNDDPDAGC